MIGKLLAYYCAHSTSTVKAILAQDPTSTMKQQQYTHIVVGAGSAGCVVTARIAEVSTNNVLLIEAGPDCGPNDQDMPKGIQDARRVPMKGQSEVFDARIDWNVVVALPGGGSMVVPQAKIVGGGSSINGGTALRNTAADSQEWVDLGNAAWDHDSCCKVYESMEGDPVRGSRGPHPILRTRKEETGKIQRAFVEGAVSTGFHEVFDLNETGSEGVGPSPVCRVGDRRISAANTFIDPIRSQPNLTVLTQTQVDKITFTGNKATGVMLVDGQHITANAEVILCAGAIFSPAILQRSGVGPSDLLKARGISVVADLPVGENLSDHPCIPIVAKPKEGAYREGDYSLQMQARWSSSMRPGAIDLQMVCFSYLYAQAPDPRVQSRSLAGTATGHVAGIGCNVNKPTSLGTVQIRSTDAKEAPEVNPNYMATEHDRQVAREIVRKAYQVLTSQAMQKVLGQPMGLDKRVIESDELLDAWLMSQFSTTYHFCSSCRMAARNLGGVVDQSGRVYGVEGVRVGDASVIPTVPAANTMATTMMFAERIGRSIRDGKGVRMSLRPSL